MWLRVIEKKALKKQILKLIELKISKQTSVCVQNKHDLHCENIPLTEEIEIGWLQLVVAMPTAPAAQHQTFYRDRYLVCVLVALQMWQ